MPDDKPFLPGPLEVVAAVSIMVVLFGVTVPELRHVVTRAQQAEARDVLREFVAAAKAHALRAGDYRCGACGMQPPAGGRWAYGWGDAAALPSGPLGDCLRAAAPYQRVDGFRAAAARREGGGCEVFTIDQHSHLRRRRPAVGDAAVGMGGNQPPGSER